MSQAQLFLSYDIVLFLLNWFLLFFFLTENNLERWAHFFMKMDNIYNEQGEIVYDPMEDVLTQDDDPNVVLETITS